MPTEFGIKELDNMIREKYGNMLKRAYEDSLLYGTSIIEIKEEGEEEIEKDYDLPG